MASTPTETCAAAGPVLNDKDGNPVWLTSEELAATATHCVAPQTPPLARSARIEGYLQLDILVDENGKVACIRVVSGHPLLVPSAIEATKEWTFRPRKQGGKKVSFYGHLHLHFSTETAKDENPCNLAR